MQINCPNCSKIFEVKDDLIPEKGRSLICGNCDHKWFFEIYKKISKIESSIHLNVQKKEVNQVSDKKNEIKEEKKNNIKKRKYINLFLVIIISFVALIIILDTFKNYLLIIFPNLDLALGNLYETLKDIELFFKDLVK